MESGEGESSILGPTPACSRRRLLVRVAAVLAAVLVIVLVLVRLGRADAGPTYNGVTLKDWIDRWEAGPTTPGQSIAAVRAIGTNGIPTLIRWLERRDSRLHVWANQWANPTGGGIWGTASFTWPLRRAILARSQERYAYRALIAFRMLGPIGKPAMPELERLVRENKPGNLTGVYNAAETLGALSALNSNSNSPG